MHVGCGNNAVYKRSYEKDMVTLMFTEINVSKMCHNCRLHGLMQGCGNTVVYRGVHKENVAVLLFTNDLRKDEAVCAVFTIVHQGVS